MAGEQTRYRIAIKYPDWSWVLLDNDIAEFSEPEFATAFIGRWVPTVIPCEIVQLNPDGTFALPSDPQGEKSNCQHESFDVQADVNRIPLKEGGPIKRYSMDVRVKCHDCGLPFRFIGLPAGLDMNGAATSVDGQEGRFCIAPKGEVLSEIEGTPIGFTVRKTQ